VGFKPAGNEAVYQHLPPRPPQVHQAVYHCEPAEVVAFTEQLDFLRTLMDIQKQTDYRSHLGRGWAAPTPMIECYLSATALFLAATLVEGL
ncbi:MAG: hypothetical protein AAFO87_17295, partial [Cyanobacteria bacterium J06607_6]